MNSSILQEVNKLDWEWAAPFPTKDVLNYKKFMVCKAVANDAEGLPTSPSSVSRRPGGGPSTKIRPRMSPPADVDAVWHAHLLRPKSYAALMAVLLKDSEFVLIDHFPEAEGDSAEEKAGRLRETGRVWRMIFGEDLPVSSDAPPKKRRGRGDAGRERATAWANRDERDVTPPLVDPPGAFFSRRERDAGAGAGRSSSGGCAQPHPATASAATKVTAATPPSSERITVLVRLQTSKSLPVFVKTDDDVSTLKQRIQDKHGIPPDMQRLVFAGQVIEDGTKLWECGIEDRSTVSLVLRLSGC